MLWILLILATVFLWAMVNVADKHVITDELRDPILCTTIHGALALFIFGIITLVLKQSIALPSSIILTALFAGIFFSTATFFYYRSLEHEEVSRVMPLLSLVPLFVLIIATIFLNEIFTFVRYLGIVSLICGAFLISIRIGERGKRKIAITPIIFTIILAAFAFAMRSVLIRHATLQVPFMQIIFWFALGQFTIATILFAKHHPKIREKLQIRGIKHLIIINVISILATFIYINALAIAPAVSLAVALGSVQSFFVFIFAISLSKFRPGIVREPLTKNIIILKLIAIALLTAGVILII